MRRHWLSVLIFALALAVSALAPAGVHFANSRGAGGGYPAGEICLAHAGVGPHRHHHQPSDHSGRHHDSCPLCQAFGDGVAPVAMRPAHLASPSLLWARLVFAESDRVLPAAPRDYARQARAPPAFS
jgi:hypothetical protein